MISQDSPNIHIFSDYQVFACSALLKSQTFNHTLYDSYSEDYKAMSESIKTEVSSRNLLCHFKCAKIFFFQLAASVT